MAAPDFLSGLEWMTRPQLKGSFSELLIGGIA